MGIFGWSYPAGAENDPNAPYNQEDSPCEVCGLFPDSCICPECPVCGSYGDPACYDGIIPNHGLIRSEEQEASFDKYKASQENIAEEWDRYAAEEAADWNRYVEESEYLENEREAMKEDDDSQDDLTR